MAEYIFYLLGPYQAPSPAPGRHVRVYVPTGLPQGPPASVLYLFDGENVFHDAPSFAGGWHLHRAVDRLAAKGLPAPVVVGIDHGGAERIGELSPWGHRAGPGRLDAMLDWLIGAVLPEVSAAFGLPTDPAKVSLGGSSMGGLAALYGHFRHPERFGSALAMSPSLWLGGGQIFAYVASRPVPPASRIYLDGGALESGGRLLGHVERMAADLRARGYDAASLRVRADPKGAHTERDWRRRAPAALRFLLGK